jgi:hypothetical protein
MDNEQIGVIVEALEQCFVSEADYKFETFNVADAIGKANDSLHKIAHAISPTDAAGYRTPSGGYVNSLSEAVCYVADSLGSISDAIRELTEAVRERG